MSSLRNRTGSAVQKPGTEQDLNRGGGRGRQSGGFGFGPDGECV